MSIKARADVAMISVRRIDITTVGQATVYVGMHHPDWKPLSYVHLDLDVPLLQYMEDVIELGLKPFRGVISSTGEKVIYFCKEAMPFGWEELFTKIPANIVNCMEQSSVNDMVLWMEAL